MANREALADLLFDSAAASLRKTIRREQGYDPAAMMVLHTWNQQLQFYNLKDESAWIEFCDELAELDWVSFIQPPPTKSCTAEQVVRYLTRYLTGGPISDSRIIAAETQHVTFMAREGKRVGGEREQVPVTIPILEFVRRWC